MSPIAAVVFDLDDTLYPESAYVLSGYRAIAEIARRRWPAESAGVDFYERARTRFESGQTTNVFDSVLGEMGVIPSTETIGELVEAYRAHVPTGLKLFDDASRILDSLEKRIPIGILTDGFLVAQNQKLAALDLVSRCRAVVCTDTFGREKWKPHPHGFEVIQAALEVPHGCLAYVGDNPAKDFVAPNALGWTTFLVERPTGVHAKKGIAVGGQPTHRLASLADLAAFL